MRPLHPCRYGISKAPLCNQEPPYRSCQPAYCASQLATKLTFRARTGFHRVLRFSPQLPLNAVKSLVAFDIGEHLITIGPRRALSGLSFADKKSCLPIAAADLLAYSAWGQEVGQKPIGELKTPSKADQSYRTNVARVDLNRDSLKSLHEQAVSLAQA
jgi:hypothetical protein